MIPVEGNIANLPGGGQAIWEPRYVKTQVIAEWELAPKCLACKKWLEDVEHPCRFCREGTGE